MAEDPPVLSEREKETLRLLLAGHDAKSAAQTLGLSVHTINERLREARRKLGVSSSREAARRLAEAERRAPKSFGDEALGVSDAPPHPPSLTKAKRGRFAAPSLAWLIGGMLIMSILIALAALTLSPAQNAAPAPTNPPAASTATDGAPVSAAQQWTALLDNEQWDASWQATSAAFKRQVDAATWASAAKAAQEPLGPVKRRTVETVINTTSLPGAPSGEYTVITFKSEFTRKKDAKEVVTLVHDGATWRVGGYFIR